MELNPADIVKFKALYRERFGIEIDDKHARNKLAMLVRQIELIYLPIGSSDAIALKNEDDYEEAISKHTAR